MKKISENKKVWIVAAVVLLVIIAVIIGVSVKRCSQKPGKSNGNIETEQGKGNGKDKNGNNDKDDSKTPGGDEKKDDSGLTVVVPEDKKTENGMDASGSWDDTPTDDKTDDKDDDQENGGSEEDIYTDEKEWGNIF